MCFIVVSLVLILFGGWFVILVIGGNVVFVCGVSCDWILFGYGFGLSFVVGVFCLLCICAHLKLLLYVGGLVGG